MMSEMRVDADEILVDTSSEISSKAKSRISHNTDQTSSEAMNGLYTQVTSPPRPNPELADDNDDSNESCLFCCLQRHESEEINVSRRRDSPCNAGAKKLRRFLSNGWFYVYVIFATLIVMLLLLAELLMDLGLLTDPDSQPSSENLKSDDKTAAGSVAMALHWTSFSMLCLFFLEIILRVFAWKIHIVKSLVAVIDCAVVTVALAINLAATLAAGYKSPFDAMALIIVFRFVRIYSLVEYYVSLVRRDYRSQLSKNESGQTEIQVLNQRLTRQVMEKEFEIKQLRVHLGSDLGLGFDEELRKALENEKKPSYETDLERAIALSKQQFEVENGFVNEGFHSSSDRMRARDSLPSIVVHHRENSMRRVRSEDEPCTSSSLVDHYAAPHATRASSVNAITHGQLHSGHGADQSQGDMQSLLTDSTNQNASNNARTWSAGYCLQDGVPPGSQPDDVRGSLCDVTAEKISDVIASDSDEGIGSVTSHGTNSTKEHSRTNTSVSIATEGASSDPGSVCSSEPGYHSDRQKKVPPKLQKVTLKGNPRKSQGGGPFNAQEESHRL